MTRARHRVIVNNGDWYYNNDHDEDVYNNDDHVNDLRKGDGKTEPAAVAEAAAVATVRADSINKEQQKWRRRR